MKKDLLTAVIAAVLGAIASFVVCNLLIGEIRPVSVKTVDDSFNVDIADPNPEIFNYRSVNPTVEVYVGSDEQNQSGND